MSAWPLRRRKERSASSIPAAIQRFFIVPSRQCFTRPVVVRVIEIIDSMQFVFVNDWRSRPVTPRPATVNMSSSPSRSDPAASGCFDFELAGEVPARLEPLGRVGLGERRGEAPIDGVTLVDGQVADHVPSLVQGAALDQGPFAEHLDDRLAQRLGTVEHGEDAVVVAQPASDEISEQIGDHDGVLGVAEDQPDGHLRPVSRDDHGDGDHLIRRR